MKKEVMAFFLFFGISLLILPGCKKNTEANTDEIAPSLFQACNCTDSTEFIRGVFDNVPMCFSTRYGLQNDFDNINYLGPNQDQLNMIRTESSKKLQIALFWQKSKIWSRALPYILPRADWDTCEGAEIQLNDLKTGRTVFVGHSGFGPSGRGEMTYTITTVDSDMISGIFSGNMFSENRSLVHVTNGEFRLRIVRSAGSKFLLEPRFQPKPVIPVSD